jgi:hypothetical protein
MKSAWTIVLCGLMVSPTPAAILFAQLLPLTGEIRLRNAALVQVPFVFYSIKSTSGALNGSSGVWRSITTTYDAPFGASPGNGFIDPNGEWVQIHSQSKELAEGALDPDGGRFLAQQAISLGRIWNSNASPTPDLTIEIRELSGDAALVVFEQAVDGDYNGNDVVDAADYVIWRNTLSNIVDAYSGADGNGNGLVDFFGDFQVWRTNFGARLPSGTAAALSVVPESFTCVLVTVAGLASIGCRRRTGRHRP